MISMWAVLEQRDIEGYAATLVLPSHLAHLRLQPVQFAMQVKQTDGREPLTLTYVGDGRLEEHTLAPDEHTAGMIRFVCPGIDDARMQLPRDDAAWYWTAGGDGDESLRVYFAPTTQTLGQSGEPPPGQDAYVSVSRGHAFVDRAIVESYLRAWLSRLGIHETELSTEFDAPSAGVEFTAGAVAGQMFLDDDTAAKDLLEFAGLHAVMGQLDALVELDMGPAAEGKCGVYDDGVYIGLTPCEDVMPSE